MKEIIASSLFQTEKTNAFAQAVVSVLSEHYRSRLGGVYSALLLKAHVFEYYIALKRHF